MNDVHLKVEELTVNGMFTWGMEVELRANESCRRDVVIKQRNSCCCHLVRIRLLISSFANVKEESVASFVKL